MQHRLAAIRAGRSQTRFIAPSIRQRQRRLGLGRPSYGPAVMRRSASESPIAALRAAGRGHVIAPATRRAVRRVDGGQLSWSRHFVTGLRRARPRSAAPWRA